jgi:gas vesicle protein
VLLTHKKFADFSRSGLLGSIVGAVVALLIYRKFGKSLKR